MATVRALAPRQREWNLHLGINQTVVDDESVSQYRQLRDTLRPLGVVNNLVVAYDTSSTYNLTPESDTAPEASGEFTTFGELSENCLRSLLDQAEADSHELPWAERMAKRYYLRGIRNRLLHARGTPNPPCVAFDTHLRLLPDGSVPTCQFNGKKIGNLREQRLDDLRRSETAAEQREWIRRCPGCWAECEVLPNAIYTLDLVRAVAVRKSATVSANGAP
jgi:hypothetical protein